MKCGSVMGWATSPTCTRTFAPSTATCGTCFSNAPSVLFAVSSAMASPQQDMGTP